MHPFLLRQVVLAVVFFDRVKVDDPVGAISVHLVNGIWGTLAVGLFAEARLSADVGNGLLFGGGARLLGVQALGVVAVGAVVAGLSTVAWLSVRKIIGLRVSEEEEYVGLDASEMGILAYPGDSVATGQAEQTDLAELSPRDLVGGQVAPARVPAREET